MIHETFPSLTETASGSHPCCVVSVTYFHGGNTGSNPVGDAKSFQELTGNGHFWRRHKKAQLVANFLPGLPNRECFRASGAVLVGTKRHMQFSQIRAARKRGCAKQANDPYSEL